MNNSPQGFFMIVSYAILFIGVLITCLGWFFFKIRALRNKPAWEGTGGKLIKFGLTLVVIGLILLGIALYIMSK